MSINNMSYDIIYYSCCCDLDTAGRQRTIVRFFTQGGCCGSGRQPCCDACCSAIANNCEVRTRPGKMTSAAASEQFLIQAQKKATRRLPFPLPANGISLFDKCNMFRYRVRGRSLLRHSLTRNDLCRLKQLHLLQNDQNL